MSIKGPSMGSEDGFLRKGLLTFKSNETEHYHECMKADMFEDYFDEMLKYLPDDSVVLVDKASYHSLRVEKTPTSSGRKREIVDWLTSKVISSNSS